MTRPWPGTSTPFSMTSSPIATPEYGARYWSGAGSSAPATTTIVYSIAPYCSRMATVLATVESFWPIAT